MYLEPDNAFENSLSVDEDWDGWRLEDMVKTRISDKQ